jgi:hypothetical protein
MTMSGRGFLSRLFGTVTNDWQAALMFFGGMVISFFCFRLALTMVRRARGMPRK